jgi:signal transduction histidine kinase
VLVQPPVSYEVLRRYARTITDRHFIELVTHTELASNIQVEKLNNRRWRFKFSVRTFYLLYLIFYRRKVGRARKKSLHDAYRIGYKIGANNVGFQTTLLFANLYRRTFMDGVRRLFREKGYGDYERAESVVDEFVDQYLLGYLAKKDNTIERLHEQRMAIMGQMAASMAHEVRNPLSAIAGFLTLIQQDEQMDRQKREEYMRIILHETKEINRIITQFLQFSRKGQAEDSSLTAVSLVSLLTEVHEFVRAKTIQENIKFYLCLPREDFMIRIHRESIKQVLVNVVHNAFEAVHNQENRRVDIYAYRKNTEQARIEIVDNGPGMSLEVLDRAFEPFYSTKDTGTGIGLALSKELVKKSGGDIRILTGQYGTTIVITLPVTQRERGKAKEGNENSEYIYDCNDTNGHCIRESGGK